MAKIMIEVEESFLQQAYAAADRGLRAKLEEALPNIFGTIREMDDSVIDNFKYINSKAGFPLSGVDGIHLNLNIGDPSFHRKSFWLGGGSYTWELLEQGGHYLLIPKRKKK